MTEDNGSASLVWLERERLKATEAAQLADSKDIGAFIWKWTPLAERDEVDVLVQVYDLQVCDQREDRARIVYLMNGSQREIIGDQSRFDPEFWRAITRAVRSRVAYDEAVVQLELADLAMNEVNRAMESAGRLIETIEEIDE